MKIKTHISPNCCYWEVFEFIMIGMVCSSCNLCYVIFFSLQFWFLLGWLIERKKNYSKRKSMWHSEKGIVVKTFLIKALWIFKKRKCFINSNYILIHFYLGWFGEFYIPGERMTFFSFFIFRNELIFWLIKYI